jgi:acyl-CoA thioesterase FadM
MNLYLRLIITFLHARWRPRLTMSDLIELRFRVWPNDLDANGHMNNGRFMTILDLGIVDAVVRSGFLKAITSLGGHLMAGGALITFRKSLQPFARYTLRMRYLGCDLHWHVFAFEFVRADGAVAAKGLLKGTGVRKRDGLIGRDELWARYGELHGRSDPPPVLPDYAAQWLALESQVFRTPLPVG